MGTRKERRSDRRLAPYELFASSRGAGCASSRGMTQRCSAHATPPPLHRYTATPVTSRHTPHTHTSPKRRSNKGRAEERGGVVHLQPSLLNGIAIIQCTGHHRSSHPCELLASNSSSVASRLRSFVENVDGTFPAGIVSGRSWAGDSSYIVVVVVVELIDG